MRQLPLIATIILLLAGCGQSEQITALQNDAKRLTDDLTAVRKQLDEDQKVLQSLQSTTTNQGKRLELAESTLTELAASAKEFRQGIASLDGEVRSFKQTVNNLSEQVDRMMLLIQRFKPTEPPKNPTTEQTLLKPPAPPTEPTGTPPPAP
jgi:septal ring factor EnvC (AmiA/AmiB activator)